MKTYPEQMLPPPRRAKVTPKARGAGGRLPETAQSPDWKDLAGLKAHDFVVSGMPGSFLNALVQDLALVPTETLLHAIGVSARTAQRIKTQPERRLDSKVSDGVLRVATVRKLAADVLGGLPAADEWMTSEAVGLEYRRPIDLLSSTPGVEMVKTLLERMRHGVYA